MTFLEYYKQQFKDVKEVWALAREKKKWLAFLMTFFCLFNPFVIYTMYLYDTGKMEIDKRFYKKWKKKNTSAEQDIRFWRWMSNLKIHEHCHCDEKTLRAIWNAMDEEDKVAVGGSVKEVKEWNNVPRTMWVWDYGESPVKRFVLCILKDMEFPVISLDTEDQCGSKGSTLHWEYCAEIGEEKPRRMTNMEVLRWLASSPDRVQKHDGIIAHGWHFGADDEDAPVQDGFLIREGDGEWREPLVEAKNVEKEG